MAGRELNLYVDQDSGRLVAGFDSAQQAQPIRLVFGDSVPVNVRILTDGSSRIWNDVDLTGKSIRVSVGDPAGKPTAGTFTITYGGDTTSALSYNVSAADLSVALNALTSITSAGGVTVTKSTNGAYRIAFVTVGARTDLTVDSVALYPSTEAIVMEAATGDASTKEVLLLKLEVQPSSYVELTTNLDSAACVVTTIREGDVGIQDVQSFEFSPVPYDGVYILTVAGESTGAIPWDATVSTIQAQLEALPSIGTGMVVVTGEFPLFTATFDASLGDVTEMTVDVSGLVVPTGKTGELNLNTTGIVELLDGSSSASATLEVEIYDIANSTSFTPVQATCTILEDLSGNTPASQTPLPTYLTTTTSAEALANQLGLTSYADLTAANAALAPGVPYYDVALARINISTA